MSDKLFASDAFKAPSPAGDSVQKFQQVIADYKGDWLRIPPHQREAHVWDFEKRREYVSRLQDSARGCHPPGSFATYQLVSVGNHASPVFLNDGFQRLTTLTELEADPLRYDMDADGVRLLLQQPITVQHRHYESHDAAMRDFQLINNGTRLTPHELCSGFLKYMPDYEPRWRMLLEDVEQAMQNSEARLRAGGKRQMRAGEHKLRRHTLALFYRFLIEEKGHRHYPDVPANEVQTYVDKQDVVELRLREALLSKGYEEAQSALKLFRTFMNSETAMLEEHIRKVLGQGRALSPVAHRWLLDLAVWRRNNQASRDMHSQFVEKLLEATRGQAQWVQDAEGGKRETVTLNLCHLGLLPRLAELAGMPDFCSRSTRRKGPPRLPGYDNSHWQPYVTHGDGPTFPESAPQNRSRGAQSVLRADDDEVAGSPN
jgi:hypothetical protein